MEVMERRKQSANVFGIASEADHNLKIVRQSKITVAPLPATESL